MPPSDRPFGSDTLTVPCYLSTGPDDPGLEAWKREHPDWFEAGTWTPAPSRRRSQRGAPVASVAWMNETRELERAQFAAASPRNEATWARDALRSATFPIGMPQSGEHAWFRNQAGTAPADGTFALYPAEPTPSARVERISDPVDPAGSVTSDGADNTINGGFIREREGSTTDGIVPKENGKVLGQSGVTVGNGVDLGSKTVQQLRNLGVAQDIIDKLTPYLGKQGQAADGYLKDHPLSLTQQQAEDLSNIFLQKSANEVADRFNSDSKVGRFSDLPGNTKTVLADIYHQYGNQLYGTNFWKQVTDGDWQGAYRNLMNFGDKYRTRRQLEAGLLGQDIQANSLPKPAEHH